MNTPCDPAADAISIAQGYSISKAFGSRGYASDARIHSRT